MEGQIRNLHEFLENLPRTNYATEIEFLSAQVPTFISILGYNKSNLFFGVSFSDEGGKYIEADAVIATGRIIEPWLLIETKNSFHQLSIWRDQASRLRKLSGARYAVFLSPQLIYITSSRGKTLDYGCRLEHITVEQSSEIYKLLQNSGQIQIQEAAREEELLRNEKKPHDLEFNEETFHIQLRRYSYQLELVTTAHTNDEKKKSLEGLAKLLFEGIPFLSCRSCDIQTSSSEIDIIVEYHGWNKPTIFDEFGRFCLVECKNWKSAVGASQIRDFKGKLEKTRVKLGIIFARNGVTGADDGTDALREIRSFFDRNGIYILVVAEEDLEIVRHGSNFYKLLDEKMFRLRFEALH